MRPRCLFFLYLFFLFGTAAWSQLVYPTQPMTAKVGDFADGFLFVLNAQGNGIFGQAANGISDHVTAYGGLPGDYAIVGNWNGQSCAQGCFNIGLYRSSTQTFILDANGDMIMGAGDQMFTLSIAQTTDIPVTGDWNGDGKTKVGLFRPSTCEWFLDYDGDRVWNASIDKHYSFGQCGPSSNDMPVVGDWTGSGTSKIGVFRNWATWILDYSGNGVYNPSQSFNYGIWEPSYPVVGNWYGGAISRVGVLLYDSMWSLDSNSNQMWDVDDLDFPYGSPPDDIPIVGNWTQNVPPSNADYNSFSVTVNNTNQGNSGTVPYGTWSQLSFTFHDPVNGYAAISNGQVYLDSGDGVQKCNFVWSIGGDSGNGNLQAFAYLPDSNNYYSDNYCTVGYAQGAYDSANLGALTLTVSVKFGGGVYGMNTVYNIVYDTLGNNTSWGQAGTITIPQLPVNLTTNGAFVTSAYLAVLGRAPTVYQDDAMWLAWVNGLSLGTMTRDQVINSLLTSAEYRSKFYVNGNAPDNTTFLTTLYRNAVQRQPTTAELNGYLSQLSSGQTRSQVVATVMNLPEFAGVNSYWINNSGMPQTTPPIVLGGSGNTTGYRPLYTGEPQYTYVTVSDPALYWTNVQSGYVWFVSTDASGNITQQCPVNFNVATGVVQVESTGQSSSTISCAVSNGAITGYGTENVSFYVTFSDAGAGNYTILANATDANGVESPWTTLGTWSMSTPNTNPTPTFTLSIDPAQTFPINLLAIPPNGGPVVTLAVDVTGYNNFNCPVSFGSLTNGILASGSGVPGRATVNLQATVGGITSFTLLGSSGNCGAGSAQGAQLSVPLTSVAQQTVPQIINSSPSGLSITVDNVNCTTSCQLQWIPGSTHTVIVPSPQTPTGANYSFTGWANGIAPTASSSPGIYTANFATQYQLTIAFNPPCNGSSCPGTVTLNPPGSNGWYPYGQNVSMTATANTGYQFTGFSGCNLSGSYNPQSCTLYGPQTITANYVAGPPNILTIGLPGPSPSGPLDAPQVRSNPRTDLAPPEVLAVPLFEHLDSYSPMFTAKNGPYRLSSSDYESLRNIVGSTRPSEASAQMSAAAEPLPNRWERIATSSISPVGKSTIRRLLSETLGPATHLLGGVPTHPEGIVQGPNSCCPTYDTMTGQCGKQGPSLNCYWGTDFLWYASINNQDHVVGSSRTSCTGTDQSDNYVPCFLGDGKGNNANFVAYVKSFTFSATSPDGKSVNHIRSYSSQSNNTEDTSYPWNGPILPGWKYKLESFHQWKNPYASSGAFPPFPPNTFTNVPSDPIVFCADPQASSNDGLYCARTMTFTGSLDIASYMATQIPTTNEYVVAAGCASPVAVAASVSIPVATSPYDPKQLTWSGGTAGSDIWHRNVACTNPGDVPVSFSIAGNQMASVIVHVINPITININNTPTNADDIAILPAPGNQAVLLPVTIASPVTAQVELSATPPGKVSVPCTTCQTGKHGGPVFSLTANSPLTVSINPLQVSFAPNDVTITAYISDTSFGSAHMTVLTVGIPTIQNDDTPPGMPPRIPPNAPTVIPITVQPLLTNSGQSLTLATSGTSDANGNFAIGLPPCGAATVYAQSQAITSSGVCLQGTAQTKETGNSAPPTAADPGGGNAGNLQVLVQVNNQAVASSSGFSVAAIPVAPWTETFLDSGGYTSIAQQGCVPAAAGAGFFGIRVNGSFSSDSGAAADLSQSYIEEQVQLLPGTATGSLTRYSPDVTPYISASLAATQGTQDCHALPAGQYTTAGASTVGQVHVIADRRTGAWNVPMLNSGFTIFRQLFFDDQGAFWLLTSKQGANVTVACDSQQCQSNAGITLPKPGAQPVSAVSDVVQYH